MGLNAAYIKFIEEAIQEGLAYQTPKLHMLELGDQEIADPKILEKTGKKYFQNKGFQHVSVDLNGQNGALIKDLSKPQQFKSFFNAFDVITNAGTSEHVEPLSAQYECFEIIHSCLKAGGVAVHLVPDVVEHDVNNRWRGHCPFYYSRDFFEMLADENGYTIFENKVINGLRAVALIKTEDSPFMSDRQKLCGAISVRGNGGTYGYTTMKGKLKLIAHQLKVEKPLKSILRIVRRK
jgi:hypothetical protein